MVRDTCSVEPCEGDYWKVEHVHPTPSHPEHRRGGSKAQMILSLSPAHLCH